MDIQLQVDDYLIKKIGIPIIVEKLQRHLEAERIKLLAEEFNEELVKSGIDNDELLKKARSEAWKDYKQSFLKNILP